MLQLSASTRKQALYRRNEEHSPNQGENIKQGSAFVDSSGGFERTELVLYPMWVSGLVEKVSALSFPVVLLLN